MTMKVTAIWLTVSVSAAMLGGCGEVDGPPPAGGLTPTNITTSAITTEYRLVMNAATAGIGGNSFDFASNT